jgi:hypothetical protein
MTIIPDTPRLRDVLDRGLDPADLLGGFGHLADIVLAVAVTPLEERAAAAMRIESLIDWMITEPVVMADGTRSLLRDPLRVATTYRWEGEMLTDPSLLSDLVDKHTRGAELMERIESQFRFNTLTVGVVGETDEERGFPGECLACRAELVPGARALMVHEIRLCLPCVRRATEGVDLEAGR